MINYPNKKKEFNNVVKNYANRGMNLEEIINKTNNYYLENSVAVIHKKPTPIQILKVDYDNNAHITDAYFKSPSTTDYNGVYKGKYLDFEAKETRNKTAFPLSNISEHQIKHLIEVKKQNGIAFLIISFFYQQEIYFLDANIAINYYKENKRKSIPYNEIKKNGYLLKPKFFGLIDYLDIIDKHYLK